MTTALAIVLAVVGAGCYALAAQLQHAAVRTVLGQRRARASPRGVGSGTSRRGGKPFLGRLVRQRRWFAGLAMIGVGALVHATALGLAPLTVVQPVGVLAVVLVAVLSARSTRSRPGRSTVLAVVTTTVCVGAFVALAAGDARSTVISDAAQLRTTVLAGAVVTVLAGTGALLPSRARCLLLSVAGGVAYGFVSVSTRTVVQRVTTDGVQGPPVVALMGIVVALAVGGALIQFGYASGPPTVVVACLTTADPFFAVGTGAVLLGESAATPPAVAAGQIVLAAVAAVGVALLARFHPDVVARTDDARRGATTHEAEQSTPVGSARPIRTKEYQVNSGGQVTGERLRLVVGADTFPPDVNGAARFSHRLATGLAARGHEVHVLAPSPDGASGASVVDGVTVHRVRSRRTPWHPTFRVCTPWQAAAATEELLAELAPDLVHIQSHFVVGRALARVAYRRGIPLVATNHFMPENLFGYVRLPTALHQVARRLAWWDVSRVFGRAAAVTAPTPRAVRLLRDNGVGGAVEPVSCGIDLVRFADAGRPQTEVPTVLFVGRLDAEKRVDELLRAAALLPAATGFRIELVGDGSRRAEWEALARRLGIADRVVFAGHVPDAELLAAYGRCAVFCLPGVAELQSLATMEAMAAGRPVVAADAMALPHLVRHGENGWLYRPGDVAGLAGWLGALLTDAGLRSRMGAASRRLITAHEVTGTLTRFEALYHRVLHAGAAPVHQPPDRSLVGTVA